MKEEAKAARAAPDWESIEKHYRAGVLSVREIASLYEVTEGAIRKHAKKNAWERDLTAKVQAKARDELVRNEVRTAYAKADGVRTEQEIITEAAMTVVQVVREHRQAIAAGRNMAAMLMDQLLDAATHRPELEAIAEEVTVEDKTAERYNKLMRAVSLGAHASILKDLATAVKNYVGLERQAFNVPDVPEPPPPDDPAAGSAKAVTEGFEALRAAFAKRLGKTDAGPT